MSGFCHLTLFSFPKIICSVQAFLLLYYFVAWVKNSGNNLYGFYYRNMSRACRNVYNGAFSRGITLVQITVFNPY